MWLIVIINITHDGVNTYGTRLDGNDGNDGNDGKAINYNPAIIMAIVKKKVKGMFGGCSNKEQACGVIGLATQDRQSAKC